MEPKGRTCVFVISHPRSGTHLLIDFIRKNFPQYDRKLKPWQSASEIYVGLDRVNWRQQIASRMDNPREAYFLLHSHYAGVVTATEREAEEKLKPARSVYFYPFRQFSTTVKSYAEFRRFPGPISSFLERQDDFFGLATTVDKCIRLHAEKWLGRDVHFIDTDRLTSEPETSCNRLAELIAETPARLSDRLPRRKWFSGMLGELAERLTGRESTEFMVDRDIPWQSVDERTSIDGHFADLYSRLSGRRVN